jgi:hypothetical protein
MLKRLLDLLDGNEVVLGVEAVVLRCHDYPVSALSDYNIYIYSITIINDLEVVVDFEFAAQYGCHSYRGFLVLVLGIVVYHLLWNTCRLH